MKGKEKRRKKREESGGPEESGHGSLEGEKTRKKYGEEKKYGQGPDRPSGENGGRRREKWREWGVPGVLLGVWVVLLEGRVSREEIKKWREKKKVSATWEWGEKTKK